MKQVKQKKLRNNIEQRLRFLEKIDSFKNIERYTNVKGRKTRENDAEHSWHMAMWFLVFSDLFGKVNHAKILKMILVHDLPEIYAGDILAYAKVDKQRKKEVRSAKKIFGEVPGKLSKEFLKLWSEYELGKTKEAKIAKSMDKLQPFLQSISTKGVIWRKKKITYDMIDSNKRKHMNHDKNIMVIYENLLKKSKRILLRNTK
jgi:putative hydrolase of HD superfamily